MTKRQRRQSNDEDAFIDRFENHPARHFLSPDGEFVAELLAHPLYCLASQNSVQRWKVMFRCRPWQYHAHAQQWHTASTLAGVHRKQRSSLLTRAAFCELLVLKMISTPGPYLVKTLLHLARCVVSRRHFLVTENLEALCQEGKQFYKEKQYGHAARSWGQAALLNHAHSHALLSTMIIDDVLPKNQDTSAFRQNRMLDEYGEARGTLGLLPNPRQKRAFLLADAGASLGCAHSTGVLARCYVSGYGTRESKEHGHKLALKSAAAGSCMGQFVLGQWFDWVYPDKSVAEGWYRLAAVQGHATAQLKLGTLLWTGSPEAFSDKAEAVAWWKRAEDQGLYLATASLKGRRSMMLE